MEFRNLGEEPAFSGRAFSVSRVRFVDPAGEEFERDVVRHPGAVAVVAVGDDGAVTLVRQMRVAVGEPVLEAPAGTCDEVGEEAESTARRELAEEAGVRASRWERLATVLNSPGVSDQRTVIFLATGLSPCETRPAGVEERWMAVETVPLASIEELAASGRVADSTTIAGMFLARAALGGPGRRSGGPRRRSGRVEH